MTRTKRNVRRGFTLLEAAAVIILLTILITMVGFTMSRSGDKARSTLASGTMDRAIIAQSTFAGSQGTYTPFPGDLVVSRNDFTPITGVSKAQDRVSIAVGESGTLGLAVLGPDGTCVGRRAAPLELGGDYITVTIASSTPCTGAAALPSDEAAAPAVSVLGN